MFFNFVSTVGPSTGFDRPSRLSCGSAGCRSDHAATAPALEFHDFDDASGLDDVACECDCGCDICEDGDCAMCEQGCCCAD